MSKHKAAGKTSQHTSPAGKRLGLKVSDGQKVVSGAILIRQSGTKFNAGKGVMLGRDHTLFAVTQGAVKFGQKLGKRVVSIV